MSTVMKTHLVKMGNSQGIRIPKLLLDQLGFDEEVELTIQQNQLVVRPVRLPRHNWDKRFKAMAEHGDDRLLDMGITGLTRWDADEWEWK